MQNRFSRILTVTFPALAIAIAAMLAAVPVAHASEGHLNAISSKPFPAAPEFAIRALDDSDEAQELTRRFEDELKAKGYRINPKSELVLTFEIIDELGAFTYTDRRYFVELHAQGSRTGGEDAQARFNVFDSKTGGILNQGEGGGTKIVTPTKYRLKVTVDGPAGPGRLERYWQGWMTGTLGASDNQTLIQGMVAPLVDNLGKTVRNEVFPLPD